MANGNKNSSLYKSKSFSPNSLDIPTIKSLKDKSYLVYDRMRVKWTHDLFSLKNFVDNSICLIGSRKTPGGKSKQFVSSALDFRLMLMLSDLDFRLTLDLSW